MLRFIFFVCICFAINSNCAFAQKIIHSEKFKDDYLDGILFIKVKAENRNQTQADFLNNPMFNKIIQRFNCLSVKRAFPSIKAPEKSKNERGEKLADLSLIYKLSFPENTDILQVKEQLTKSKTCEYVVPQFVPRLCYVPNDDSLSQQYALFKINAFTGWDIHKGDTNMVIGVTDTGIDPFHPDIIGNIKYNYADPINGIDDDNDGFIDNYRGWDTGANDNDPKADNDFHGQHVSGLCSATPNNIVGIAGSGYFCKLLPIKIANQNGALVGAYDGLIYAAEHGCKVINCSWGGFEFSELNQDLIRYAAINKDCIIFCGAGNNNDERLFYPASYEYAVSVGATNEQDFKADFSTYGHLLDLFAPGDFVLSTWADGGYLRTGGTSMAAPVAAGCAGILRSAFPTWSSQQITEQLKVTCDAIDQIPQNAAYAGKMGKGRVNLFRALTETGRPSVILNDKRLTDNGTQLFLPGSLVQLNGVLINYLSPANNVTVTVSSLTPAFEVITPSFNFSNFGTLDTLPVVGSVILLRVNENAGFNEQGIIKVIINADGQVNDEYLYAKVNANFININTTGIKTSIGNNSLIGLYGDGFLKGNGYQFNNQSDLLYEGGLMVGAETYRVADNVRGEIKGEVDEDFFTDNPLYLKSNNAPLKEWEGQFYSSKELNLIVKQRLISDTSADKKNFFVLEYDITNYSNETYFGMYGGIFTDWDLVNPVENESGAITSQKIGYVKSGDSLFCGVKVLNDGPAIFNVMRSGGSTVEGVFINDGFSSFEKYLALSTNNQLITEPVGDIVNVVSTGPFNLNPGESKLISFAVISAKNINEIGQTAALSQQFYNETIIPLSIPESKSDINVFPNPANEYLSISTNDSFSKFNVKILEITGKEIKSLYGLTNNSKIETSALYAGLYILKIESKNFNKTYTISIQH
jgi:subtilisin family serine protease